MNRPSHRPAPRALPAHALAPCLLLLAALLLACGGGDRSTRKSDARGPNVSVVLGDSVADEDTPEGVVASFEARLANTAPDNELHAPTLERLAIAHIEWADALGDVPESDAQREKAVARFGELAETHPEYEGVPAGLLMRAFEQQILGDDAGATATLDSLVTRYPNATVTADARLALADAIVREDPARAQPLYEAVVAADPNGSERTAYARYQLAAVQMSTGSPTDAFASLVAVATDAAAHPELAAQARVVAAHVYARTEGASVAGARDALAPLADDGPALDELVAIVESALASDEGTDAR